MFRPPRSAAVASGGRLGWLLVIVLGLLVAAAGCGQETPTDYSDAVEENFLSECEGNGSDNADLDDDEIDELRDECECAYDTFRDELDFDEFKRLDVEVRSDSEALPDSVYDQLIRCMVSS